MALRMRGSCSLSGLLSVVAAVVAVRADQLALGLGAAVAVRWKSLPLVSFCKRHTRYL